MSGLPPPPDPLTLLLKRIRERMNPELKQAILTIMDALGYTPWPTGIDDSSLYQDWAKKQQRERIKRAERGVKTRRKNAKKAKVKRK